MSVERLVESLGELDKQRDRVIQIANSLKRKAVGFSRSVREGSEINASERADDIYRNVEELRYESIVLSSIDRRVRLLEKEIV